MKKLALFPRSEHLLASLLLAYVGFTTFWPLLSLFSTAFQAGENGEPLGIITETLLNPTTMRALTGSLYTAGLSVIISAVSGIALALAISLVKLRAQSVLSFLILTPLIIPSQTMALAWVEFFALISPALEALHLIEQQARNPLYSANGIALVMGIEHMPLVFIATRTALRTIPADLVEAAHIIGIPTHRIVSGIILPIVFPSILAGALLAFTAAIGNFGIPALLGIPGRFPVLTTLIYQRLNSFGPTAAGEIAVLALLLAAIASLTLLIRSLFMKKLSVPLPSGKGMVSSHHSRFTSTCLWGFVLLIAVAPLIALMITALLPAVGVPITLDNITLKQFSSVLTDQTTLRAFLNSFLLSSLTAILSIIISVPLSYLAQRYPNRLLQLLDILIEAPWVIPGTVVALSMILAFLRPLPLIGISLYGTIFIMFIAYMARFLPLVLRPVTAAAQSTDPSLDEAGKIVGASLIRRIRSIFLPAVMPAAIAGGLLVFMTAFNELTLSALLWSAGHETIGVVVFSLQYQGNSTGAAAVAILSIGVVFALAAIATLCSRWLPKDVLPWQQ